MKLNHPTIKKAGIGITTLLLHGAILQTGLFARDEGGLTVRPLAREAAESENKAQDNAEARGKKDGGYRCPIHEKCTHAHPEVSGRQDLHRIDRKEQLDGGILRLPTDVLYCEVTPMEKNDEGGDVFLGVWGNGGPMTEEGKQLQRELWEKIKAKKKERRHDQWLKFHGDQPAPPQR